MFRKCFFILFDFLFVLLLTTIFFVSCSFLNQVEDSPEEIDPNSLVTAISFNSQSNFIEIDKGSSIKVNISVNPSEVQNQITLNWESEDDLNRTIIENYQNCIDISTSNYDVIISGQRIGNTWIKAECNGIVATLMVAVKGEEEVVETQPYIYSPDSVIEMLPDTTYTLQASLYGGSVEDMEDFTWDINTPDIAEIVPGRNNCIIKTKAPGSATITAKHPKAKYEYSFIVFCYTDKLTIPYITTSNNVLTIDRNESETKHIKVDLKNPYTSSYINDFKWEFADEDSKNIIAFSSSQNDCEVRGLTNGIARIKVTHPQSEYPLYIVVRVNTIVKNTYIGLSQSTLIIKGSESIYSVTASIQNYDGNVDLEKFNFEIPPESQSIMDCNVHGNVISIQGKKNGKAYIKVSHELSQYKRTLLVILQEQIGSAIDSSMFITTDQNYVQTKVGEPATRINVRLIGGIDGEDNVGDDTQNFTWYVTGGYLSNSQKNEFVEFQTHTGSIKSRSAITSGVSCPAYIDINPVKEGEFKIHVSHPRCLYETEINVRVLSEYALTEPPVIINTTESLYRLVNNKSEAEQGCVTITPSLENADNSYLNELEYKSEDITAVKVEQPVGPSTIISAIGSGKHSTYVNIHHPKAIADKKILVLSADSLEEVLTMKAIYSDTSYLRLTANTTKSVSLKTVGLASSDYIEWTSDDSSIVTVDRDMSSDNCNTATLRGISKGRTNVKASLADCEPVVFEVTVLPVGESPDVICAPKYLTTNQNAVVIEEVGNSAILSVTGINISNQTQYNWSKTEKTSSESEPAFALAANHSDTATITAEKAGKAVVHVEHPESENGIDINVKCGSLLEWTDDYIPYIVCENGEDVVNLVNGQEPKTIACSLANTNETGTFSWIISQGNGIIDITGTVNGVCTITPRQAGQAIITVSNSLAGDVTKEILINVANSEEELKGYRYLTTKTNVINIGQGMNKTVTVEVVNSSSPAISGFFWSSTDLSKATVTGTANTAVIYGKELGTVKIEVSHEDCDIPLEIIVNVIDPIAAAMDPYISCPNIITCTVDGEAQDISAELIGGSESQNTGFNWSVEDSSIASVYGSNSNAKVKAVREGVTRLVIQHPNASTPRRVLVICEPKQASNCYITVSESIIKMAPSDSAKTITASLVNGSENDMYAFKWWADDYNIINMNPAQAECSITPISTGTVNLHVSHPKANSQKDIVLYISQYSDFAFAESSIQLETGGTDKFVQMEVPASGMNYEISFESSDSAVCTAWGNTTVCSLHPGSKTGSCNITAYLKTKGGIVQATAQLLVSNEKKNETRPYIGLDGQTVASLNRDETRKFTAALYGSNLVDKDSKGLKWYISKEYQNIITFNANALYDQNTGMYITGKECQIKALNSGKAVLKIMHDDDDKRKVSPLLVYIIVNGSAEPSISFNWQNMDLLTGEESQELIATILNSTGEEPEWNIVQVPDDSKLSSVCDIVTNGCKSVISPKNTGKVYVTATLKSNGMVASCTINVSKPPRIEFFVYENEASRTGIRVIDNLNVYPGKTKKIYYRSVPKQKAIKSGTNGHYISDSNRITCTDCGYGYQGAPSNVGTILVTGASSESETPVIYELTTVDNIKKSITLTNLYNYSFNIGKSAITMTVEEAMSQPGGFLGPIDYTVSPACSELYLYLRNDNVGGISFIKNPPTVWYVNSSGQRVQAQYLGNYSYRIADHQETDPVTEKASGNIWIESHAEFFGELKIDAINTHVVSDSGETQHPVGGRTVNLSWYYQHHSFSVTGFTKDGLYSDYDSRTNTLVIGDGENISGYATVNEPYSTMRFTKWVFNPSGSGIKNAYGNFQSDYILRESNLYGCNNDSFYFTVKHNTDFGANGSNYYYRTGMEMNPAYEVNNRTVKEFSYAGNVTFSYLLLDGSEGTYNVPVYVKVRNCAKNY